MEGMTWEVWVEKTNGKWGRVVDGGNGGVFEFEKRALAVGGKVSQDENVLRVVIIKRVPVAELNGAAKVLRQAPRFKVVDEGAPETADPR